MSVPTTAEKSETQQLAVILDLCLRKTLACSGLSVIGDDRIKRPGDERRGGLVEKEERSDAVRLVESLAPAFSIVLPSSLTKSLKQAAKTLERNSLDCRDINVFENLRL